MNNLYVVVQKSDKSKVEDYGSPEDFIKNFTNLLGSASFFGETASEGGFAPNQLSRASLLGVDTEKDKKGKTYYKFDILTRTGGCAQGCQLLLVSCTDNA